MEKLVKIMTSKDFDFKIQTKGFYLKKKNCRNEWNENRVDPDKTDPLI